MGWLSRPTTGLLILNISLLDSATVFGLKDMRLSPQALADHLLHGINSNKVVAL